MLLKCKINTLGDLPTELKEEEVISFFSEDSKSVPILKEKIYVAYALEIHSTGVRAYVANENYSDYPWPYPLGFFEIIDNRISKYWSIEKSVTELGGLTKRPILSFPEWVNDPQFLFNLVDGSGERAESQAFFKYKELMDLEFPDPSLKTKAAILYERWLQCPACEESWEANASDGNVRCPQCQKLHLNPLYVPH